MPAPVLRYVSRVAHAAGNDELQYLRTPKRVEVERLMESEPEKVISERRGATKQKSMTAAEFESVLPLLNISEVRIEAARLVLVENMTYAGAVEALGVDWKRQAIGFCVKAVWEKFQKLQESQAASEHRSRAIPDGWEQVTLVAPRELIPSFYKQIASCGKKPGKAAPRKKTGKKNEE